MSRLAPLSLGELIEHWTLRADEIDLVAVKHGDSKLAFALLLRFYGRFGRFPRNRGELHPDAVEFMARAVKADPAELAGYDWSGRTIKRHRHEIRAHFGFRLCGEEDGAKVVEFLAAGAAQRERRYELIKEEFLAECRLRSLEPPSPDQTDRYVRSALSQAGKLLAGRVAGRLTSETIGKLLTLIGAGDDRGEDEEPDLLRKIKSSPGAVSLATMLGEIGKLTAIVSFGLPDGLFADVAPRVVREWRDQAMTESPSPSPGSRCTLAWSCPPSGRGGALVRGWAVVTDADTQAGEPGYLLDNAQAEAPARFAGLEASFDALTQQHLAARGVRSGWRCLEVGAGSGSVARWLVP